MVHRYYHRLSPWQQRVYRQSDTVTAVPVPAPGGLADATRAVGEALARGEPRATTLACNQLLHRLCARLDVRPPTVTVLAERPAGHWGELHGLYNPGPGQGREQTGTITVWMRTAQRGQVVAFRTFLRTLLHELCHHLDFALLGLSYSFHTTGFNRREASLQRQLLPPPAPRKVRTATAAFAS